MNFFVSRFKKKYDYFKTFDELLRIIFLIFRNRENINQN